MTIEITNKSGELVPADQVRALLELVEALSCRNVEPVVIEPVDPKVNARRVKAGKLPPIEKRLPEQPWVVKKFAGDDGVGKQGGQRLCVVLSNLGRVRIVTSRQNPVAGYPQDNACS